MSSRIKLLISVRKIINYTNVANSDSSLMMSQVCHVYSSRFSERSRMTSKCFLSFLFLLLLSQTIGTPVKDRFQRQLSSCKILVASQSNENVPGMDISFMLDIFKSYNNFFIRYNCSIIYRYFSVTGEPLENGSYTGFVGIIQRHEADTTLFFLRPDSLVGQPVIIGPVVFPSDAVIVTQQNNATIQDRRVTSFVNQFDNFVYTYTFIVLVMVAVVLTACEPLKYSSLPDDRRKKRKILAFIRQLLDNLKELHFSLLDQNTLEGSTNSSRILVTSFYGFLFFLLYGIYLNAIGADLISLEIPGRIQGLQQLLSSRTYRPVIIRGLVLRQILDLEFKHRPDSDISQLYLSLIKNPDESIVEINLDLDKVQLMLEKIIHIADDVKSSQAALIFPEFFYKAFRMYSCSLPMLTPRTGRALRSKETFAQGHVASLISNHVDPDTRKVLEYFFRNMLEFDFLQMLLNLNRKVILGLSGGMVDARFNLESLKCEEGTFDDMTPKEDNWRKFNLRDFDFLFACCFAGFCLAFLVLRLEIWWYNLGLRVIAERKRRREERIRKKMRPATA